MLRVVLISSFAFGAQAQACEKNTGGSCRFFGCDASRGATVCANGACMCKPGFCSKNGVCVMQEQAAPTPAPAPDGHYNQDECNVAYTKRCYTVNPWFNCCNNGNCQAGNHSLTCNWGFSLPCCPDLLGRSYTYDPETEGQCQDACKILGQRTNLAIDYCPGGTLEARVQSTGCAPALASLQEAMSHDLVNSAAWGKTCENDHANTCNWEYSTYVANVGTRRAQGTFTFGDEPGCVAACDALGNPNHSPPTYCGDGSEFGLDACSEAKESFEKSDRAWCPSKHGGKAIQETFLEVKDVVARKEVLKREDVRARTAKMLEAVPASFDTALESECLAAWQGGCWNKTPFTDCCNCAQSANSAYTCSWGFKFQGEPIHQDIPWFYGQSCPDVCNTLSQETSPTMFCDGPKMHEIFMSGNKCPQAYKDWLKQYPGFKTKGEKLPGWCVGAYKPDELAIETSTPMYGALAGAVGLMVALGVALRLRSRTPAAEDFQPLLE